MATRDDLLRKYPGLAANTNMFSGDNASVPSVTSEYLDYWRKPGGGGLGGALATTGGALATVGRDMAAIGRQTGRSGKAFFAGTPAPAPAVALTPRPADGLPSGDTTGEASDYAPPRSVATGSALAVPKPSGVLSGTGYSERMHPLLYARSQRALAGDADQPESPEFRRALDAEMQPAILTPAFATVNGQRITPTPERTFGGMGPALGGGVPSEAKTNATAALYRKRWEEAGLNKLRSTGDMAALQPDILRTSALTPRGRDALALAREGRAGALEAINAQQAGMNQRQTAEIQDNQAARATELEKWKQTLQSQEGAPGRVRFGNLGGADGPAYAINANGTVTFHDPISAGEARMWSTVYAQREKLAGQSVEHARKILADARKELAEGIGKPADLQSNVDAAAKALADAEKEYKDIRERAYATSSVLHRDEAALTQPANAAIAKAANEPLGGGLPKPTTQAEYDALPPGASYIDPQTGQTARKRAANTVTQ